MYKDCTFSLTNKTHNVLKTYTLTVQSRVGETHALNKASEEILPFVVEI